MRSLSNLRGIKAVLLASVSAVAGTSAFAQTDVIVVTAERTEGTITTTPIAITAIGGDDLRRRGINNIEGLTAAIPNLTFGNQLGTPNVNIRGIGLSTLSTGQESNIAFNLDGVYLSRPAAAQGAFFDVERIEVLRGPQGTLYGRNATGGSINIITAKPTDEFEGYGSFSYGEFNRIEAVAAISGPLNDNARFRLAGRLLNRDGYGTNVVTGNDIFDEESYALRGTLDFDLPANFLLRISADYYRQEDASNGYSYIQPGNPAVTPLAVVPTTNPGLFGGLGGSTGGGGSVFNGSNVFDESFDSDPTNDRAYWGTQAELTGAFGDIGVTSRTSYRSTDYDIRSDIDGADVFFADISQEEDSDQFSQEIIFNGEIGDRLDWLFGLYYFSEEIFGNTVVNQPFNFPLFTGGVGNVFIARGTIETDAYAVFANARFALTDTINIVGGIRYSAEDKTLDNFGQVTAFGPPVTGMFEESFDAVTPRGVIEFQPNENAFFYASATRGFKSGGFDLGTQNPVPSFNEEFIWSYETGAKLTFAEGAANLNLTGFYGDYSDLQVGRITGVTLVIENAAQATVAGIEAEFNVRPTDQLSLYASATYLNAEFDEFLTDDVVTGATGLNLSGNRLPQAPEFAAQFGGQLSIPMGNGGQIVFDANGRYTGDQFFSAFNRSNAENQEGYFRADLNLSYISPDNRFTLSAYGRNLGEQDVLTNSFVSSFLFGFPEFGFYAPPQQFGGTVSVNF